METTLLVVWVAFLVLGLAGAFGVLFWAIRNRQFSNQEHARQLPLSSNIPDKDTHRESNRKSVT